MQRWPLLVMAMVYPTILSWAYFVALAQNQSPEALIAPSAGAINPAVVWTYTAGKIFQFALPLWWAWRVKRLRVQFALPQSKGVGIGVTFSLIAGAGAFVIYQFLRDHSQLDRTAEQIRHKIQEFGLETPAAYLFFAVFLVVVHSFLEEYYWRWFLFRALQERVRLGPAILFSSLAFMAHHVVILGVFFPGRFWQMTLPLSLGVGIGGAFWAWLYNQSGSLYPSWLSHLLIDAAIMAVGYEMLFG